MHDPIAVAGVNSLQNLFEVHLDGFLAHWLRLVSPLLNQLVEVPFTVLEKQKDFVNSRKLHVKLHNVWVIQRA